MSKSQKQVPTTKEEEDQQHIEKLPIPIPPPLSSSEKSEEPFIYPISSFPSLSLFDESYDHPALIVPIRKTAEYRRTLKHVLWHYPKMSNVVPVLDTDQIPTTKTSNDDNNNNTDDKSNKKDEDDQKKNSKDNTNSKPLYRKLILERRRQSKEQQDDDDDNNNDNKYSVYNDPIYDDPIVKSLLENGECCKQIHTIKRSYKDLSVENVLKKMFHGNNDNDNNNNNSNNIIVELPSSFEIIGSIIHLNLRDDLLPYKYLIGKVILDFNQPRIQTVVNKLGNICNVYRTFGMEIIASTTTNNNSKDWSEVIVKEDGCQYELDFQQVYWNSRLGGEHRRLVNIIRADAIDKQQQQQNDSTSTTTTTTATSDNDSSKIIVADLMAGIGPFAIPLTSPLAVHNDNNQRNDNSNKTKKQKNKNKNKNRSQQQQRQNSTTTSTNNNNTICDMIEVYANDLNPISYKYLKRNMILNKCNNNNNSLFCYNMDARQFVHYLMDNILLQKDKEKQETQESSSITKKRIHHYIMNLPATAPEFLDAFRGYPKPTTSSTTMPKMDSNNNNNNNNNSTTTDQQQQQQQALLPRIHVYCFGPKEGGEDNNNSNNVDEEKEQQQEQDESDLTVLSLSKQKTVDRCSTALGYPLNIQDHNVQVHTVRDVAPKKNMYCVSFTLPISVCDLPRIQLATNNANNNHNDNDEGESSLSPEHKRAKLS